MANAIETLPDAPEIAVADAAVLDEALRTNDRPFVVRGLAADWPLVLAGLRSAEAAQRYLLDHHRERPFTVSVGVPGSGGRLFYDDAMAMNFRMMEAGLPEIFTRIAEFAGQPDAPSIYLASIDMHQFFDGLHEANKIDLGERDLLSSIWIGTRTRIAAHNDVPHNLAVCAVGRRRFTLFPREQFRNLYLGPVDNTPAGRAVSMVDLHAPDLDRHPHFAEALATAQVANLAPGDAVYIPALWWHHVEGTEDFNVLVNYWWRDVPRWMGQPQEALNHAMMTIRDLPADQKAHWRDMFDHYVFGNDDSVVSHIPEGGRGILDPMTPELASRVRSFLLRTLSR